jgi:radical SAM protein with 4Fe4S-binding SPASM domain
LRDLTKLSGKCGMCEYRSFCAGCRARAYYATGDYLSEEPYCAYLPAGLKN